MTQKRELTTEEDEIVEASNDFDNDLKYYQKEIKNITPNQVRIIRFWRVRGFNILEHTLGLNITLNRKPKYQCLGLCLQYLEQFEKEAIKLTAKEIFNEIDKIKTNMRSHSMIDEEDYQRLKERWRGVEK